MLKTFIIVLCSVFILYSPSASIAQAPVRGINEYTTQELVEYHAEQYGASSKTLSSMVACESGGRQEVKGDGGNAHGTMQIWSDTWKRFTKEMGEDLDINSQSDQIKVGAWAITHNHGNEWTTYRAIQNGGTYTFYSKREHRLITVYCK